MAQPTQLSALRLIAGADLELGLRRVVIPLEKMPSSFVLLFYVEDERNTNIYILLLEQFLLYWRMRCTK